MQNKDYKEAALRTESNDFEAIQKRISSKRNIRLLHAGIGLATESGEFLDALKKAIFYGKELDRINLQEEIGDLLWYCAIALDELGADFDSTMSINIQKLKARFPNKFTEEDAENRNLDKEREILEK